MQLVEIAGVVWMGVLTLLYLLLWRDFTVFRTKQTAQSFVEKSGVKEYVVPGKKFFTTRKKMKPNYNDDDKFIENEANEP